MKLKALIAAASLGMALMVAAPGASATTYTGIQDIGGETVDLSITTDGTLGEVSKSSITAFSISASGPLGAFNSASTDVTFSQLEFDGLAENYLTATSTALTYTITPNNGGEYPSLANFFNISEYYPTFFAYFCVGNDCGLNGGIVGESIGLYPYAAGPEASVTNLAGTVVTLGTVSGAPEPSPWAFMIVGLAGVGFSLRQRKRAGRPTFGGAFLA